MAYNLEEYYNLNDDSSVSVTYNDWYGQTFTTSSAFTATKARLKVHAGTAGTVNIRVYATSGGQPTGSAIATAVSNSALYAPDSPGWFRDFVFTSPVALSSGVMYAIVIEPESGADCWVRRVASGSYSGGTGLYSSDQGSSWSTLSSQDFMFEIYSGEADSAAIIVVGSRDAIKGVSVWGIGSDGAQVWGYDTGNTARSIQKDASGNIYICGTAADNGDGNGTRNIWKISDKGAYIDGVYAGSIANANTLWIDSNYLYVAGNGAYRLNHDLTGETTIRTSAGSSLGVDSSGNIYVGGGGLYSTLIKYNSSLVFQWEKDTNDSLRSIDFLANGDVIVGTSDGEIRMYKADGSSPDAGEWAYVMNGFGPFVRARVYNDEIFGCRFNGSGSGDGFVVLNSSGVKQWGDGAWIADIEDVDFNNSGIPFAVGPLHGAFNILEVDNTNEELRGIMAVDYALGDFRDLVLVDSSYEYAPDLSDVEGQWTLNDNGDTTVLDATANLRHGTASRNTSIMTTAGKINTALGFVRADNDDIDLGDNAAWELTPSQDKTYAFWCYWSGTGSANFNVIFHKYFHASSVGIVCVINRSEKRFQTYMYWEDATLVSSNTLGTDLTTGWHLCVIRVDRSGNMYVSVNNGEYSSYVDISAKETDDLSNSQHLMLGENPSDLGVNYERYEGALDNFAIWNRLLSVEEEGLLWNNGSGTEDFGLVIAPVITDQSSSTTKTVGQAVSFYITATGDPAPSYQWYLDGSPISGETNSTLDFTCAVDSGGVYTCKATNDGGTATSADIVLSVPPIVTDQSSDTSVLNGVETTFSVTAAGYPTLTYQWYRNTTLLVGETNSSISVFVTQSTVGTYACLVTNVVGSVWSEDIELTIRTNPYRYRLFDLPLDSDRIE